MILKLLAFVTTTLIIRSESLLTESTSKPSLPRDLQELLDSLYMTGYIPEYILPEDELTETEKTEGEYIDFPELKNAQENVFVPPESEYSKNSLHYKNIKALKQLIPDRYRKRKLSGLQQEIQQPDISPEELRADLLAHLVENFTGKDPKSNSSIKLDFLIPIPERGVYPSDNSQTELCSSSERYSSTEGYRSIEHCNPTVQCRSTKCYSSTEQSNSRQTQRSRSRSTEHNSSRLIEPCNSQPTQHYHSQPTQICNTEPTEYADSRPIEFYATKPTKLGNSRPTEFYASKSTELYASKSTNHDNPGPTELYDSGPTEPMNNKRINLNSTMKIPNPQVLMEFPNSQGSMNTPNPQGFMNTPNPQGFMNTPNPQEFMNTFNTQGFLKILSPQWTMNIPNPQGPMNIPNPQGSMNIPNPQGSMDILNPQGSMNTPDPRGSMKIPNPQGFMNILNPQGSMNTLDPRGSMNTLDPRGSMKILNSQEPINTPNPQGFMNIPNPTQWFMNMSDHKQPMNLNNFNKESTKYTTLKQYLFTLPEYTNIPKYPGIKPNTTIHQPITFEIISPKTEKNIKACQYTMVMQFQPNVTIKPALQQQIKSMLNIQLWPKQLLPQFIVNTKQPENGLRATALEPEKQPGTTSSLVARINRTIHPLKEQTIRTVLDNSSRRVDSKAIDKNIATNVVSLMADPSSINKMEAEGVKAVIKPSISVNSEITRNIGSYFERQSNNSSEITKSSSQNTKNKERKYIHQNSLNNSTGKENIDSGRTKKKMFTFLNIFKKNKKYSPPDAPGQNFSTQMKREIIENYSNELYKQLLETNGMNDNNDVESQYPIKQEFEEEETFKYPIKQELEEETFKYPIKQELEEETFKYPIKQELEEDETFKYPIKQELEEEETFNHKRKKK